MSHLIRINIKGIKYHLVLNEKFDIEQISNDCDILWSDESKSSTPDEVLIKYALTEAYEKEKSNLLFQDYFKLPIQINQKAAIKGLARSSVAAFFCILISVLPIPIISAAICSHPVLIILGVVLLALASVQIKESIVSLKF